MCQMDIDKDHQNEQTTLLNVQIYAVDEHGTCHLFETETVNQSQSTSRNMDVSESIIALLNQIDNSLQLTKENSIQSISLKSRECNDHISKTKKTKKRKLRYHSRRLRVLKKQFKAYLKKKKTKQQHSNNISNIIAHHQSERIESSPIEHSTMIDLQLSPDLSKRKYIYKDISLSNNHNNNHNQMNWRIFQCTQQPSSMSCLDQTVTNERTSHPFYCANNPISLPDIRIGLSRHHSIKQLHKTVID